MDMRICCFRKLGNHCRQDNTAVGPTCMGCNTPGVWVGIHYSRIYWIRSSGMNGHQDNTVAG
jgi:hypothetical protein